MTCKTCGSKYGHQPWCPDLFQRSDRNTLTAALRMYADVASAGDKGHWGLVMRQAAAMIFDDGESLKMAYCREKGADSTHGLDCDPDYREWRASLRPN